MVCTVCGNATMPLTEYVRLMEISMHCLRTDYGLIRLDGCDLARRILTHTDHRLIYSDDFGETWTDVAGPSSDSEIHRLLMTDSDTWYVGTVNDELWTTFDSGRTWKLRPYSRGFQHPPST